MTVQPGEQNQTVTVTESVPLVETTNATLGGTLENADIVDLPLNGRDYQNLLGLRPGVMLDARRRSVDPEHAITSVPTNPSG